MINSQGSCDGSISECIPVVGHLVAYVQSDASSDSVSTTKNLILDQIKDDITTNTESYSNLTQNIVFVSEHRNDNQRPNVVAKSEETTNSSSNSAVIIILAVLVSLVVVSVQVLLVVKKRRLRENKKVEVNEESKEKSNEISEAIGETARMSLVPAVDHEERADFAAATDNLYLDSSEAQTVSNDIIQTGSLIDEAVEEYVQRMYRKDEEMKSQASYQQMLVDVYCNQKTVPEVTEPSVISQQTSEDQSDNLSSTDPDLDVLPAGWIALEDPNSGNTYYANEQTNETTWEIPQVNDTS